MRSERIEYFDIAKGIGIISVVVYHIAEIMGFRLIMEFVNTYFLSLFFFISGYFVCGSSLKRLSLRVYVIKNSKHLLIPFFVIGLINNLWQSVLFGSRGFIMIEDPKGGYWFLLVLFMFLVTMKILYDLLLSKIKHAVGHILVLLIPFAIVIIASWYLSEQIWAIMSLSSYRRYYLVFVVGFIIRELDVDLRNTYLKVLSAIGYIVVTIFFVHHMMNFSGNVDFALWLFTNVLGCLVFLSLSDFISKRFISLGGAISQLGKVSLGIYVVHFFFKQFFNYLYDKFSLSSTCFLLLIAVVVVLVLSYAACILIKRSKMLSKIVMGGI